MEEEIAQKPTPPPLLQMHLLSADCVLWARFQRLSGQSIWEPAPLMGLMLSCIHTVRKCLQVLWQLKKEVPNSALGSRGLMAEVGTPVGRHIWVIFLWVCVQNKCCYVTNYTESQRFRASQGHYNHCIQLISQHGYLIKLKIPGSPLAGCLKML